MSAPFSPLRSSVAQMRAAIDRMELALAESRAEVPSDTCPLCRAHLRDEVAVAHHLAGRHGRVA